MGVECNMYAIQNKKIYRLNISEDNLEIFTKSAEKVDSSFKEVKIQQGFFLSIIYTKEIKISDIELAYELRYKVIFKGMEYDCLKVDSETLDLNYITIYTSDSDIAEKYGFKKKEQFIFDKNVSLDEIDALIEIKKPILKFSFLKEKKITIVQKDVRAYLATIIE